MKFSNLTNAIRCLFLVAVMATAAATDAKAGDIPITPKPCNPSIEQCPAPDAPQEEATPMTEEPADQSLFDVMMEAGPALAGLFLSLNS